MAKKTKSAQQRSKEEQWRKRMAAQAQRHTGVGLAERDGAERLEEIDDMAVDTEVGVPTARSADSTLPRAAAQAPAARPSAARSAASQSLAAQRRVATASRTARTRLVANQMSLEDEMYYVRLDIRRLVTLTAICLAVLIALAFIIQ